MIFRALKGLENMIPVSVVNWYMRGEGWTFHTGDGWFPMPSTTLNSCTKSIPLRTLPTVKGFNH